RIVAFARGTGRNAPPFAAQMGAPPSQGRGCVMFSTTLSRYLARHFVLNFVVLMALLTGIIFLFEAVEMLRRATKFDTAGDGPGYDVVLGMSLLKLPHTAGILMPFGILFAAIYTCWKLNKTHELIVVRAAGLSVWQFLAPLVGAGVIIGVL